ncbi:hypothetical protein M060_08850 [Streptococcus mitis 29/42]|uniref:Phage protein n=1 Tax=Streptococcus mitis 29/42 TaxID=1340486 RepID=S7XGB2_STRMT|nr:hypothetical protein M060_08850 [Streptococcus mitis 29/42]
MNKQDALKQIEEQRDMILELHGWGVFGYIKGIINQLDEPQKIELPKVDFKKSQKVKVPQCVADWIEYCKVKKITLAHALYRSEEAENKNVFSWIVKDSGNQETFARAWLDGYEVEKEKRYLVKVKGMSEENTYLTFRFGHTWMLSNFEECEEFRLHHTRKQLEEAGFGWVFDCPGIEIEEVE